MDGPREPRFADLDSPLATRYEGGIESPTKSITRRVVRGAVWVTLAGAAARALTLGGTLALTYFLAPDTMGEVSAAWILFATAQIAMGAGVGTFVVTRSRGRPEIAWHATVIHVTFGALAVGAVLLFAGPLIRLVGVPGAAAFLPGMAAASFIDRLGQSPERILERDLAFAKVARARMAGDVAYVVLSVALSAAGMGGQAIVVASVGRAVLRAGISTAAAGRAEWLAPSRLSWPTIREILMFTFPLTIANFTGFASRKWDNLIMSRLYGATVLGHYNLAYNLAEIPATQFAEPICDVLLSSFSRLPREQHEAALVRAISLSSLVVFPLAMGLSAVAGTAVAALLPARWAPVGPMLVILAGLSVTRPVSSIACSYLIAQGRTRLLMWITIGHLMLLGASLSLLGRLSALWGCVAVGATFATTLFFELLAVRATDGIPLRSLFAPVGRPLLACAPMVLAVLLAREGLGQVHADSARLRLLVEVVAGALAYAGSAWLLAPAASRDLLRLLRSAASRAE